MPGTPETSHQHPKHQPLRTCAGTGQKHPQNALLRFVNVSGVPTPEVMLHPTRRAPGRGVYVCPTPEALASAVKRKTFANKLKTNQPPPAWETILTHLPLALQNPA